MILERSHGGIRGDKMVVEHAEDGKATIIGRCVVTGQIMRIKVWKKEILAFLSDSTGSIEHFESIKKDRSLREFLISGMSPAGWDRLFGKEKE